MGDRQLTFAYREEVLSTVHNKEKDSDGILYLQYGVDPVLQTSSTRLSGATMPGLDQVPPP
jgi:hypothetical protein